MTQLMRRWALPVFITSMLVSAPATAGAVTSSNSNHGSGDTRVFVQPRRPTLVSPIASVALAVQQKQHTGRQLCVSRSCKQREWLKHHPRPSWIKALRLYSLNSTAYCDRGETSTPRVDTKDGIVAVMRSWPLGRWYQVRSGVFKGKILQGEDHIGSGSEFDIWMESCSQADWYGRGQAPANAPIQVAEIRPQDAKAALTAQRHSH
jgi:hypothetical protein